MSAKRAWYKLTHDDDGDMYGWIIARRHDDDTLDIVAKGYSKGSFLKYADLIISSSCCPDRFLAINPAGKGTAYKLTAAWYAAKNPRTRSMESAFLIA